MVRIRLSRRGKKKRPFYRIVVTDIRIKRDGAPIEQIGTYDPLSKSLKIDKEKAEFWIKKGAKPTGTVLSLLKK
ncbi:MAG: 30S ribosomal protein S16 [Candidatus Melainabacteria bacterium RIFCSPLOWO2_02_FULL_35_15]|nr:MAG: 30S ribosomal protein S16 [Candidatus Melainabacteria bacterium RIFCSPLOWO2_12_FULL_35_11]OGI13531.1 MAG: 30S ribosomal protein S16 [Candidatus Melainabacteria bacterium RIFCSPLOWO2_02_FULL_35_15]